MSKVRVTLREDIYRRDCGLCRYCAIRLTREQATVDHVVPVSKGGRSTLHNLVLACSPCNLRKGDMTLAQARRRIGMELREPSLGPAAEGPLPSMAWKTPPRRKRRSVFDDNNDERAIPTRRRP